VNGLLAHNGDVWGLTGGCVAPRVRLRPSTLVLVVPWDAEIRQLNLGTWAGGEQLVQPTVPSRSVSVVYQFRSEEGTF